MLFGQINKLIITLVFLFFLAKADEALKAKERSEEEAKKRKEEGNAFFYFSTKPKSGEPETDIFTGPSTGGAAGFSRTGG